MSANHTTGVRPSSATISKQIFPIIRRSYPTTIASKLQTIFGIPPDPLEEMVRNKLIKEMISILTKRIELLL